MSPQRCLHPNPWTLSLRCLTWPKDFAEVIKVRLLMWGNGPGLSWWPNVITGVLLRGRQGRQSQEGERREEKGSRCQSGAGPKGRKRRQPQGTGKERQEKGFSPRASEGTWPC